MADIALPVSGRAAPRDPLVGAWLLLICALVVAMILVGGATRLTDSGLSITEWNLGKGLSPPMSAERWDEEFALYQRTTEYQLQNRGMSLAEFQGIYWWEWAHRFLGKAVGVVFAVPFLIFWGSGRLRGRFIPVVLLFALGAAQGGIGWWMVTSGLAGRLDVSPVRLAVHLGLAFLILALALKLALGAFGWPRAPSRLGLPHFFVQLFAAMLFAQILLGALMAGADAGKAYADWPTIGGEWLPSVYGALKPADLIENTAALQFNHRMAGYAVLALAFVFAGVALRWGRGPARPAALATGGLALAQAGLGIAAVMTGAHLTLSLFHQAGAIALWIAATLLWRASRWK